MGYKKSDYLIIDEFEYFYLIDAEFYSFFDDNKKLKVIYSGYAKNSLLLPLYNINSFNKYFYSKLYDINDFKNSCINKETLCLSSNLIFSELEGISYDDDKKIFEIIKKEKKNNSNELLIKYDDNPNEMYKLETLYVPKTHFYLKLNIEILLNKNLVDLICSKNILNQIKMKIFYFNSYYDISTTHTNQSKIPIPIWCENEQKLEENQFEIIDNFEEINKRKNNHLNQINHINDLKNQIILSKKNNNLLVFNPLDLYLTLEFSSFIYNYFNFYNIKNNIQILLFNEEIKHNEFLLASLLLNHFSTKDKVYIINKFKKFYIRRMTRVRRDVIQEIFNKYVKCDISRFYILINICKIEPQVLIQKYFIHIYHILRYLKIHVNNYEIKQNKKFIFSSCDFIEKNQNNFSFLKKWIINRCLFFISNVQFHFLHSLHFGKIFLLLINFIKNIKQYFIPSLSYDSIDFIESLDILVFLLFKLSLTISSFAPVFSEFIYQNIKEYFPDSSFNSSIHSFHLLPIINFKENEELNYLMKMIKSILSLSRFIRNVNNISKQKKFTDLLITVVSKKQYLSLSKPEIVSVIASLCGVENVTFSNSYFQLFFGKIKGGNYSSLTRRKYICEYLENLDLIPLLYNRDFIVINDDIRVNVDHIIAGSHTYTGPINYFHGHKDNICIALGDTVDN